MGGLKMACAFFLRSLFLLCFASLTVAQRELLQRAECEVGNLSSCTGNRVCVAGFEDRAGTCADVPVGGVLVSTKPRSFPVPVAYFPLSGPEAQSWPSERFEGEVDGATLTEDADFGAVYRCRGMHDDSISLGNVKFGSEGGFAINLWVKKHLECSTSSRDTQYIFSTARRSVSRARRFDRSAQNQVHMIYRSGRAARSGELQVIVNDNDDREDGFSLDVDPTESLLDGQWHMLTVSTLPSTRAEPTPKGFRVFVDGKLVAETEASEPRGGDVLRLDGEIRLCKSVQRFGGGDSFFDGSMAQLSIFDTALTPEQIEEMYTAAVESIFDQPPTRRRRRGEDLRTYENSEIGLLYVRDREVDSGVVGRPIRQQPTTDDRVSGVDYTRLRRNAELCKASDSECEDGQVCAVIHPCTLNALQVEEPDQDGICTEAAVGGSIWVGSSVDSPVPLAYFPLTHRTIQSWPIANKRGYRVKTSIVDDDVFGSVLSCKREDRSVVVLEHVPYGINGTFGVNLWFKAGDLSGRFLQYLFSHGTVVPTSNPWAQNQLQIMLPETNHVASGVLRAIVKDSEDDEESPSGAIFLDSDGEVAVSFTKSASIVEDQPVSPTDGLWHMVTITSRSAREAGFSMFLDGQLVGTIDPDEEHVGDTNVVRSIPAGDPLRMGGKIYLCGRNDGSPSRHFDGFLAELSLYDVSLSERDIQRLYDAALEAHPELNS